MPPHHVGVDQNVRNFLNQMMQNKSSSGAGSKDVALNVNQTSAPMMTENYGLSP